jgi:hypothetical protein
MARHVSYRGATIDMDSMRRENEKVPAIGNMPVNAKGDQIKGGRVTKTADEIARERGRIQTAVVSTGLKGPMPEAPAAPAIEKKPAAKTPVAATTKPKETELPSGDIIIDESKE